MVINIMLFFYGYTWINHIIILYFAINALILHNSLKVKNEENLLNIILDRILIHFQKYFANNPLYNVSIQWNTGMLIGWGKKRLSENRIYSFSWEF